MTKEDRWLTAQPHWVSACAYCNVDTVFESLAQIVKRDTDEMTALPRLVRRKYTFLFEPERTQETFPRFRVRRINEQGFERGYVLFEKSSHTITITSFPTPPPVPPLLVTPIWDEPTHRCKLAVAQQIYDFWEISEKALKPLFFDPGD
jgi:hypothetical protein